ncbi:MAG: hypothetical protein QOD67_1372 [Caballeronia sp.]|nr:hypothetical protein [Caballeronia sp.]
MEHAGRICKFHVTREPVSTSAARAALRRRAYARALQRAISKQACTSSSATTNGYAFEDKGKSFIEAVMKQGHVMEDADYLRTLGRSVPEPDNRRGLHKQ